jgi:CO/xanthine dehydrogenase Mo-binding subunit
MSTTVHPSLTSRPDLLGTDEARIDGHIKVSGQAKYTGDYTREGMLWAAFVASPHPHARIVRVDAAAAKAMSGVRAVLTGADIGERFVGCTLADWPVLAFERVRFVGEWVVAVAADTRAIAEAAAATIDVTYEELPPQFDPEASIAAGAPLFHADDSKFAFAGPKRPARPHPNMQGYDRVTKGDPDAALAKADRIFEHTFRTPRYHAGYLEPRATLVWTDAAGVLHVISSNKNPFRLREMIAQTTGLALEKIVVEPSFIGGEFGAKSLTIEEFPLIYLAQATGKPVKYIRTHADDVRSTHVRHASTVHVKLGTTKAGKMVGIDVRVLYDGGAYGAAKPGPGCLPGRCPKIPYAVEHARVERISAYTNTIPGAFVRAPGDVQILFGVESLVDMAAAELHIDPIEFRALNAVTETDSDFEGNPYAQPRASDILRRLRTEMKWDQPLPSGRGRGVALTARHFAGGKTSFNITVLPNGDIVVDTGSTEPGVGTLTVIQRVLAAELGLDPKRISVIRGATDAVPVDPGIGGSKATTLLGRAAIDGAHKIQLALEHADVVHLGWDRAVAAVTRDGPLKVVAEGEYVHKAGTPIWLNFAGYGVDLSVDRDTGQITFHEVVFVADIGTVINPLAHRGQIDGGFMMGFGHALTEELYVEDGRIQNLMLSEYKLPCQLDMPPLRVIYLEPDGGPGPYGARSAGEFNIATVPPAISNAIASACGIRLDALSLTAERIHAALQSVAV